MTMEDRWLLGKPVADKIKAELTQEVAKLKESGILPKLAILRVGEKPDDIAYQNGATKAMESLGIAVSLHLLPFEATTEEVAAKMEALNKDDTVHGVLMLRPLPEHIDENQIRNSILPQKDVDCMSTLALANVLEPSKYGKNPCTPQAVIEILKFYNIPMAGQQAVVLGRSTVIGKPVALLLTNENATVTLCHSKTKELQKVCCQADILVAAIGKANFVTPDFVKEGSVVIDVGINMDENNKLVGDVSPEAAEKAKHLTPVPRGVGSVTTAVLAMNLVRGIGQ